MKCLPCIPEEPSLILAPMSIKLGVAMCIYNPSTGETEGYLGLAGQPVQPDKQDLSLMRESPSIKAECYQKTPLLTSGLCAYMRVHTHIYATYTEICIYTNTQ